MINHSLIQFTFAEHAAGVKNVLILTVAIIGALLVLLGETCTVIWPYMYTMLQLHLTLFLSLHLFQL